MRSIKDRRIISLSFSKIRSLATFALAAIFIFGIGVEAAAHARNNSRFANKARLVVARNAGCGKCEGETKSRSRRKANYSGDTPCHSKGYVDPKIAGNLNAAVRDLKRAGINPQMTSLWRSSEKQAALRRCSQSNRCRKANPGLYRPLPAGQSLHEAGFAVDISGVAAGPRGAKRITPRGRRIVSVMRRNGFNWPYGLKDPAHFEANPRRYGYRNAKQAIARSQSLCDAKAAPSVARRPGRGYATSPVLRRQSSARHLPVQLSNPKTRSRNSRA